jgi:hypothetical protein
MTKFTLYDSQFTLYDSSLTPSGKEPIPLQGRKYGMKQEIKMSVTIYRRKYSAPLRVSSGRQGVSALALPPQNRAAELHGN